MEVVDLNLPLNRQAEIIAQEIRKEAKSQHKLQLKLDTSGPTPEGLKVKVQIPTVIREP